ncbi:MULTISPECIES: SDR family NAD(P)-dependent oxidoreductase [Dickeya]|uniref:Oxidoreductase, short-chain dehydrogenase/reductase family n=1 Tax=Dickeya aquatica TaxID=1401087 RepID=A0A375AAR8_9GAMM|nr:MULTISPECIES: SDR family NAD(P)-dependent oxidoreductase [Dickeya]SLM63067.1 Oxidoreductase, short-chain dehydrogenase/reductase family [Dickeya aquatica]
MKRVLITGASSGIGKQLAGDYADDGWEVIACGRNAQALATLDSPGRQIHTRVFDVSQLAQTRHYLAETPCDLVILNAGTCEYLEHGQIEVDKITRVFATNLFGPVYCLETLLPQLQAGARIVVIGSLAGLVALPRAQAYGASKAALAYFTQSLRLDLHVRGIGVTLVMPGFVDTPLTQRNDFPMPMQVSVQAASRAIRRGIAAGRDDIRFPAVFAWLLGMVARLPLSLQQRITQRLVRP